MTAEGINPRWMLDDAIVTAERVLETIELIDLVGEEQPHDTTGPPAARPSGDSILTDQGRMKLRDAMLDIERTFDIMFS